MLSIELKESAAEVLDGGGVFAVFVVADEYCAIVELATGWVANVPIRTEGGRGSAALPNDKLVLQLPGDSVVGDAAADAPGGFTVAVDGEDASVLQL